jgi:hypothetical protein
MGGRRWRASSLAAARVHLRGLHYRLVAAGDVKKPNGKI